MFFSRIVYGKILNTISSGLSYTINLVMHFSYREIRKKQHVDRTDVVGFVISGALQNALSFCITNAKYCIQNQSPLSGADDHASQPWTVI